MTSRLNDEELRQLRDLINIGIARGAEQLQKLTQVPLHVSTVDLTQGKRQASAAMMGLTANTRLHFG
jgi:hypothetical protein